MINMRKFRVDITVGETYIDVYYNHRRILSTRSWSSVIDTIESFVNDCDMTFYVHNARRKA